MVSMLKQKLKNPMVLTIIGLIVIFGGVFGWYGLKQFFIKQFFAHFTPPPMVISTVVARSENWQPYLYAVGSLSAINGVDISPEVPGQIKEIYFHSGDEVKAGDKLIRMDDASERAQLKDIQAQLTLAEINSNRTNKLFSQKVASQASVDDATSKVKQLKANLDNVTSALDKKLIRAPFDGKIGIKQVNVGQTVSAGQVIASLQASHYLHADFALPQQDVQAIVLKQKVSVETDAYPKQNFNGFINAIDSKVDDVTRTIALQATVDNPDGKLYPGMYVTLSLFLPQIPNSVVVPQTAITYTLYGDSAFIVTLNGKKDKDGQELGTVKRVFVRSGDKKENSVVVLEGIKPGDIVVNSGQLKLDNGTTVAINNSTEL